MDGWTATSEDTTTDTDTVNATGQTAVKTVVDQLQVASLNAGADYNNAQVKMLAVAGLTGGPKAIWDNNEKTMTIEVATDDTTTADLTTLAQIKAAVEALPGFTANAVIPQNGLGQIYALQADANATANTGNSGGNTLLSNTVMQLGGTSGSQSFNFSAGTSVNDIANAINLVSDSTGVTASQSDGLLTINSAAYGSKQYAAVSVTSEGIAGTLKNSFEFHAGHRHRRPGDDQRHDGRGRRQQPGGQQLDAQPEPPGGGRSDRRLQLRDPRRRGPLPIGARTSSARSRPGWASRASTPRTSAARTERSTNWPRARRRRWPTTSPWRPRSWPRRPRK